MIDEERYPFQLQASGPSGHTEVWVRVHVAPTDNAARAWMERSGLRPRWDAPPPGLPQTVSTSGSVTPPAAAPVR